MSSYPKRSRKTLITKTVSDEEIAQYIREIDCENEIDHRFKRSKICSTFIIEEVPADPEELLVHLFTKCIVDAIDKARENGQEADHIGATITSQLLDYDLWIPIRPIQKDTVDNILTRFLLVSQSKDKEGRGHIWSEPFTINIHTVAKDDLPRVHTMIGRGAPKFIEHRIKEANLLKIRNHDTHCLFQVKKNIKCF
jgi:hypothetical protein